jgi:hypothetical protein
MIEPLHALISAVGHAIACHRAAACSTGVGVTSRTVLRHAAALRLQIKREFLHSDWFDQVPREAFPLCQQPAVCRRLRPHLHEGDLPSSHPWR